MIKPTPESIAEYEHLSIKNNWRITQLPNEYYQTEVSDPEGEDQWVAITRRTTIAGAEEAIDSSIEHYKRRLEFANGPKVVRTY